ncbi:MAG: hypothetical protein LBG79_05410 [Spirochaetaceae bacterium]|nr:hypothetical protein [Spirochaetaceae bacterium]
MPAKNSASIACAFFLIAIPLYSQEAEFYYIKQIEISPQGRTTKSAVERAGGFKTGEQFQNKILLEQYIAQKKQRLLNQRVLESVEITYTLDEKDSEGRQGVILFVETRDTRNFIILPEPKYSSNSGFEPALKIRDYNFFGTMMPLKIDIGYTLDEFHINDVSKGMYSLTVEMEYPFRAAGFDWLFTDVLGLSFVTGETLSFSNFPGISVKIPVSKAFLNLSYTHGIQLGEEYYSFEKANHKNIFEPIDYMYSLPEACLNIPFVIYTEDAVWSSSAGLKANYRLSGNSLEWRNGPSLLFKNGLGVNNVDWRGNFRSGRQIFAAVNNSYNIYFNEWQNSFELTAVLHKTITNFFAASARFRYKHWFNDIGSGRDEDRLEAGNMLRGILDRSLTANALVSFNFDFPFRVLRFLPSEWFGAPKLRYFNFELQLSPVLDVAFGEGERLNEEGRKIKEIKFSAEDAFVSGGMEALIFPLAFRSLFLRVSAAWNLRAAGEEGALPSGSNREIYIGLGHFY